MIAIARVLRGRLIAAAFVGLLPVLAAAQTASPASAGFSAQRLQKIDEFIDRAIAAGEVTGGVALIARNGRIVYQTARGTMDASTRQPMPKDAYFRMASMTKPIAATAILMLVEDGKVRLDDPVSRYLPSFRSFQVAVSRPPARPGAPGATAAAPPAPTFYTVPAEREVTVLDLLTHTSGVMSGANSNSGGNASFNRRHELGLKWVDNLGTESALEFQPGTRWAYSAVAGLDICNRIVEIVSGQSFKDYVQARIFGPLGMKDTFYWPTAAQRARLVTEYNLTGGKLTPAPDPDSMSGEKYFSGGGGLMSTAESYARFAMMLANGGELNGTRILSPAMVKLMGSQIIPDTLPGRRPGEGYGLGVRHVSDRAARRTLIANDSFGWSGFYGTHFWVDPSSKLTAILMFQTAGLNRTDDFETAVMQAMVE